MAIIVSPNELEINVTPNVTKEQIGLGNCDNTSDLNKPISTATQAALDALSGGDGIIDVITLQDYIDDYLMYRGDSAIENAVPADPIWKIQKIVTDVVTGEATITYANGTADYVHVWDDRLTYTYS